MVGTLGCKKCCTDNFAGFNSLSWELFAGKPSNGRIYNPYDPDNLTNRIGRALDDDTDGLTEWNDISEFLLKCRYKQVKDVQLPGSDQLLTLSLNIRSLTKNIEYIADNMTLFNRFDVLCFNETNCREGKLANGLSDLALEGFH